MFVVVAALIVSTNAAHAWHYTLTNGNSSVTINADDTSDRGGMGDWTVDCKTQLYQQWFWYRNGATGGEKNLAKLSLVSATQTGSSILNTLYRSAGQFDIGVKYTLVGGVIGSGNSTVFESIGITNTSASVLDFHFFQYVDFDLGGNNANDTVSLIKDGGLFVGAHQTKAGAFFSDEVASPGATHGQAALWPTIYSGLTNNTPTTLSDYVGPVTGDSTWAFQWDVAIPVGGYFNIAIAKSTSLTALVPEPSVLAILLLGVAGHRILRRSGNTAK